MILTYKKWRWSIIFYLLSWSPSQCLPAPFSPQVGSSHSHVWPTQNRSNLKWRKVKSYLTTRGQILFNNWKNLIVNILSEILFIVLFCTNSWCPSVSILFFTFVFLVLFTFFLHFYIFCIYCSLYFCTIVCLYFCTDAC